jgi:hypothetical protein
MKGPQMRYRRGKQRGSNRYQINVYFEDGSSVKFSNDANRPLPELRDGLDKVVKAIDAAVKAGSR